MHIGLPRSPRRFDRPESRNYVGRADRCASAVLSRTATSLESVGRRFEWVRHIPATSVRLADSRAAPHSGSGVASQMRTVPSLEALIN